jgi:hypothetical protein
VGVTRGVVGVEVAAGGRTAVAQLAKLMDVHGVRAGLQAEQEAGHKEAGGRLDEEQRSGDVKIAGHHFNHSAPEGRLEVGRGRRDVRPHGGRCAPVHLTVRRLADQQEEKSR